ncbi:N-glycosylase [Dipodascopsis tothii]|uniref:N-glycosylase n=1 Tax=Dipodascopsis tothii TaxID=44089 RepID=UPI0034CE83A5
MTWGRIKIPIKELSLDSVLRSGQSFRWKKYDDEWVSVLHSQVLILKQDPHYVYYRSLGPSADSPLPAEDRDVEADLRDYFNLNVDINRLYSHWASVDRHFEKRSQLCQGVRILRQDPWENLCCFICSSNNNIKRISQMVENLCSRYGSYVASYNGIMYYSFPPAPELRAPAVDQELRKLGFGYRAAYIQKTADKIAEWQAAGNSLHDLRTRSLAETREFLMEMNGVGPKVADCVCLMSMDKHAVVPIDTHMWNVSKKLYKDAIKVSFASKSMTKLVYDSISSALTALWGDYAGWAQQIIFTSDLSDFQKGVFLDENAKAQLAARRTAVKAEEVEIEVKTETAAEVKTELVEIGLATVATDTGRSKRTRIKVETAIETTAKATLPPKRRRRT